MTRESRSAITRAAIALASTAVLSGCPLLSSSKPTPAPAPAGEHTLKSAVQQVAGDLAKQIGTTSGTRQLIIDPLLDRASGQQTGGSMRVESELRPALGDSVKGITILPFDPEGTAKARFVVSGTIATVDAAASRYAVSVALTDRQSGIVIAQSAGRFRETGLDDSPTTFYRDSPSLVKDRSVDGYLKTSETKAGSAADALYVEQIPTGSLLANALTAYNDQKWEEALAAYTAAAGRPDGQQLRTFNGVYLTNIRLNRLPAAEEAFGKIAALGLATNNLAVKLLFRPNSSTEFFSASGSDLATVYPMWIRQIAKAAQSAGSCLNIVGHTSRSGSEAVNDRLSQQRAETVKRMLETESRPLGRNLRASGVGYRENVVGTGADDASDAVDRRVEFRIVPCSG
jgi:outer membrane protein OmpA-like peptidoglycan-associated protein